MRAYQGIMMGVAAAMLLSACGAATTGGTGTKSAGSTPAAKPYTAPVIATKPLNPRGLEAVMGQDATALIQLFGPPRLDVIEETGRKLQFSGAPCVLDAYLYATQAGGRQTVTYVDARNRDGAEVDRAACVQALQAKP